MSANHNAGHGESNTMKITLKVWRQTGSDAKGELETYHLPDVQPHMSFLEMLDILNERLVEADAEPVAFEHDCREGICGCCGFVVNGQAHGPEKDTTVCQLHMRTYKDGDTITIEPFRAKAFPLLKDLVVDRNAFDRIQAKGGYVSSNTGGAQDANAIPIPKEISEVAFDAAACIGCGACVASCPNAAAMLFVSAKISHLALLPQGEGERGKRAAAMVEQMDKEGFGSCSNHYECEASCPKGISVSNIARLNREFTRATVVNRDA